jgi:hypothetical protein
MGEAIVVFVIFALFALWELERIAKNAAIMRIMMEGQQSKWREACNEIVSIRNILEKEMEGRDRHLRQQ